MDDYANTIATAGTVSVGGQITGTIELPADQDWFKVFLTAGTTYLFDLRGADGGGGTLGSGSAEARLALYDTQGYFESSAINGGAGGDPLMSFVPTVSGTYYLGVEDLYDTGTGSYTLRVTEPYATPSAIIGTPAGDVLFSTPSGESIDGGAGSDTVVFDGNAARYTFSIDRAARTTTVVDAQSGQADVLTNVESLQFGTQLFALYNAPKPGGLGPGVNSSFLCDTAFYLLSNPELVPTITSATAAQHYLDSGASQGLRPNAWFDPVYYANKWSDLTPLDLDDATLFMHYNLFGVWEGRSGGPIFDRFDGDRYLRENPDVAGYVDAHVGDFLGSRTNGAIAHYILYGADEGRVAFESSGGEISNVVLIGSI